jgi:hypothetical protein
MSGPVHDENFSDFIKEVLGSCNFNWHVKLGFVRSRHPRVSEERKQWESVWAFSDPDRHEGWTKMPDTGWDCVQQWLDKIQMKPPRGAGIRNYLWLGESQSGGDATFHVLVADWDDSWTSEWESRWKEISHGWAKTRELDNPIGGLLGHLVMRVGCVLELNCAGFQGHYYPQDFRPWRARQS